MKETQTLKQILEALFFASNTPLSLKKILSILGEESSINKKELKVLIKEMEDGYQANGNAFEIVEIAEGFVLQSRAQFHPYIQKLYPSKKIRLSPSILEALAIVAYKQPITKVEVEEIRGVDSSYALSQLLERNLVINRQKLDAPGQPSLYETTSSFLEHFGLKNLKDLPPLPEETSIPTIAPSSN